MKVLKMKVLKLISICLFLVGTCACNGDVFVDEEAAYHSMKDVVLASVGAEEDRSFPFDLQDIYGLFDSSGYLASGSLYDKEGRLIRNSMSTFGDQRLVQDSFTFVYSDQTVQFTIDYAVEKNALKFKLDKNDSDVILNFKLGIVSETYGDKQILVVILPKGGTAE